jgi:excisionase family DNA binding protein
VKSKSALLEDETATRRALAVDVPEAARLLAVSPATLYKILASGDIPFVRIGRARRISVMALASYIAEQGGAAAGPPPADAVGPQGGAAP